MAAPAPIRLAPKRKPKVYCQYCRLTLGPSHAPSKPWKLTIMAGPEEKRLVVETRYKLAGNCMAEAVRLWKQGYSVQVHHAERCGLWVLFAEWSDARVEMPAL